MQVYNDELRHFGIPGMKWRKRNTYGKMPIMLTTKRQLEADKNTLNKINSGNHQVSIGLNNKRQTAYNERDKAKLEERIAKNTDKLAFKKEYAQMQKDTLLHPVHSTVEQFKLLKNKPLKALNLDLKTAKELNDAVKKRVDADKANRQKHIDRGSSIITNMFK